MTTAKHPSSLSQKIFIYKIVILLLATGAFITSYQYWELKKQFELMIGDLPDPSYDSQKLPYYNEIMDIIRPLDYSVIPTLTLQTDITLSLDFKNKNWTLHKFHQYEPNGDIILDYGRYGLCAELASYTYSRIKPFLSDRYTIKFAHVTQSGFFHKPGDSHVILIIYDRLQSNGYLIDPSLHRYGPVNSYRDYLYYGFADSLDWVDNKQIDVSFQVNQGMPLLIHNGLISFLIIRDCNGAFDKDNFILSVQVYRRFQYTGENVFVIKKQDGRTEFYENKQLENQALSSEDINVIKKTLVSWFHSLDN